tara:strand:- start:3126 stop:3572 length:447 start_codon:yes stop_codon:yes gene_type:complete
MFDSLLPKDVPYRMGHKDEVKVIGSVEAFEWVDPFFEIHDAVTDALGKQAGAVKYDVGKARMELLPLAALEQVAAVMTFGANKYADNGWKQLANADSRYTGALLRHLTAIQGGEVLDPESGLPHIAHVACNAIFLTHFEVNKESYDKV